MKKLIIIGAGGHGEVCREIAITMNKWQEIIFLDNNYPQIRNSSSGAEIVGVTSDFVNYLKSADFFVAIGSNEIRATVTAQLLDKGCSVATLIASSANIQGNVFIEKGSVVMPNAVINTGTRIDSGTIVNTSAVVDHDCQLGQFVHISPSATLCGTVVCKKKVWVGAGATIINNLEVGENTMIGAGVTVRKNITKNQTYIG